MDQEPKVRNHPVSPPITFFAITFVSFHFLKDPPVIKNDRCLADFKPSPVIIRGSRKNSVLFQGFGHFLQISDNMKSSGFCHFNKNHVTVNLKIVLQSQDVYLVPQIYHTDNSNTFDVNLN